MWFGLKFQGLPRACRGSAKGGGWGRATRAALGVGSGTRPEGVGANWKASTSWLLLCLSILGSASVKGKCGNGAGSPRFVTKTWLLAWAPLSSEAINTIFHIMMNLSYLRLEANCKGFHWRRDELSFAFKQRRCLIRDMAQCVLSSRYGNEMATANADRAVNFQGCCCLKKKHKCCFNLNFYKSLIPISCIFIIIINQTSSFINTLQMPWDAMKSVFINFKLHLLLLASIWTLLYVLNWIENIPNILIMNLPYYHCLKMTPEVAFAFSILAFSTKFCPIKIDLSGNTVWPQAPGFQKLAKIKRVFFSFLLNFCPLL